MKSIIIINGPNLNLLGVRDTATYGQVSFETFFEKLKGNYPNVELSYYQSNVEGELINAIQSAIGKYDGIVLNAGGYTHTSVAIGDAVGAVASASVRTVEVHISNILKREEFRHISYIAPVAVGSIMGFGLDGYNLAIDYLLR